MAVPPVPFTVGVWSHVATEALAGATACYAGLTALYAGRAFRHRLDDRWSATVAALVMAALAVELARDGPRVLPAPFAVALLAIQIGAIALTLTYTLGRYQEVVDRFTAEFGARLDRLLADALPEERFAEWQRLKAAFQMDPEQRRKTPHLMMGVLVAIYGALGSLLLRGLWAMRGGLALAGEGTHNLYVASHAAVGRWLVAGQVVGLLSCLGLVFCVLPTELLRLRYPELSYPFKSVITSRLRRREKGLFGAHYYIAASVALVALWLTRDPAAWDTGVFAVCAAIAVSVFADAASALVGTRWGRRKWPHNAGKSYLGSLGGTLVAFLVALPFVGVPMALASAAVFLVVDLVAPVPIPVSDNLLNPIGLALAYTAGHAWLHPLLPYY